MSTIKPLFNEFQATEPTLISLASEARRITDLIVQNQNDEFQTEIEKELTIQSESENAELLSSKVDGYVYREECLGAEESLWRHRAEACTTIAQRLAKAAVTLRERVKLAMQILTCDELKGTYHKYKLVKSKSKKLVITDESLIPQECKMVATEMVIDKEKIKMLLEDGIEVPGTHLEPILSLRTYDTGEND